SGNTDLKFEVNDSLIFDGLLMLQQHRAGG
ncbi:MAG: hypothetical protein RL227_2889, partial [Pseudomonadota bacterium]